MSDRVEIFRGDITTLSVDAIVNAANERLTPGGGVCGAIHRAAGPGLAEECARVGPCPTGEARITGGHRLPARHVIHAVGPVWHGGGAGEDAMLAKAYRNSLELARAQGLTSIAFPAISTGVFGYPMARAARIAVSTVLAWLEENPDFGKVVLCVFDDEAERAFRTALAG